MQSFDFSFAIELFSLVISYAPITLSMTLFASLIALVFGLLLSWAILLDIPFWKQFSSAFIFFFRSTPLLVQLFLLYYGLPQIFPILSDMSAFQAATLGLGLHFAAYVAELFRGAFLGIDRTQNEAALSVGMTRFQSIYYILLPQALRIATPGLMNNFIDLLKSTSLAFTLGVTEMMAISKMEAASSFNFFESYLVLALIFAALVFFFSVVQKKIESKMSENI